jgi:hypothetical protein
MSHKSTNITVLINILVTNKQSQFLDTFAKLRNAIISFVISNSPSISLSLFLSVYQSICPSVRPSVSK